MSAHAEGAPKLSAEAERAVGSLLDLLASDPTAPSSVRERDQARLVHVADSLSGLVFEQLATAARIADVGAGAGFPGLVLAAALPDSRVELIESVSRKCEFMGRAIDRAGLENATVVCDRAETWAAGEGRESYDAVCVRAVGTLATLAELASPLLREGGVLVAWKGMRDADEEAAAADACERLAMAPVEVRAVGPYTGSRHRHLHLYLKTGATPAGIPRRPGMAKKRPLGR